MTAAAPVDFDGFTIPFEGDFDLIIANHMLTHVVRPRQFLDSVRRRLRPGGHLYLYNEPDDAGYLLEGKSMFGVLNAFHLQAFDGPSLTRALAANGFEVRFITCHQGHVLCLARAAAAEGGATITPADLDRRLLLYRQARDVAILRVPEHTRPRVAAVWPGAVDRALAAGLAEVRGDGRIRLRRRERKSRRDGGE